MRFVVCRGLVALCLLALGGWAAAATLYKWVDAQGVVHYSDTPHPGAEVVHVSGAQTYHDSTPVTSPAGQPPSSPPPARPAAQAAYSCAITQPASDAALYAPETVDVSVQASPGLRAGDSISVQVDGSPLAPVSADGRFTLPMPERGTHTISAQIRGTDGTVLCDAANVSFSVQRPSVNSPASPIKPH